MGYLLSEEFDDARRRLCQQKAETRIYLLDLEVGDELQPYR
jgi:hypothetical protein